MASFWFVLGTLVVFSALWAMVSPERIWGDRARGGHRILYRLAGLVAAAGGLILISKSYS